MAILAVTSVYDLNQSTITTHVSKGQLEYWYPLEHTSLLEW